MAHIPKGNANKPEKDYSSSLEVKHLLNQLLVFQGQQGPRHASSAIVFTSRKDP